MKRTATCSRNGKLIASLDNVMFDIVRIIEAYFNYDLDGDAEKEIKEIIGLYGQDISEAK